MIPLLRASHLQPTIAVTVVATALALSAGRGQGAVWVALAVVSGQLSVGWSNDYLDRDRDRIAHRSDKPIVAGEVAASVVARGAIAAALLCVPLSLMSGWRAGTVHLAAVAAAWIYNAWLQHTLASAAPYAFAFGMLPAFVTLGLPGHPLPAAWATAAATLMGTGAHFVNVLPDMAGDAAGGLRGLVHRIGRGPSLFLGALFMISTTVILMISTPVEASVPASVLVVAAMATVLGIVITGIRGRLRTSWTLTLVAAGINVAIVITRGGSLVA